MKLRKDLGQLERSCQEIVGSGNEERQILNSVGEETVMCYKEDLLKRWVLKVARGQWKVWRRGSTGSLIKTYQRL